MEDEDESWVSRCVFPAQKKKEKQKWKLKNKRKTFSFSLLLSPSRSLVELENGGEEAGKQQKHQIKEILISDCF